jgi:NitT/TauT family transport system ATP-binding protein
VPTTYPKSSPTEMQGLLVLLQTHKGSEDVALLADDLDLEIDEILPSLDFAAVLGLLKVKDGRATFTELGQRYIAASIRGRKAILQEQLRRTTLFRTILRALETAPEKRLTNEQLTQVLSMTSAMADEAIQNIVNWGRYAGLIRYDPEEQVMVAVRLPPASARPPPGNRPPPSGPVNPPAGGTRRPPSKSANGETQTALVATATA